MSVDSCAWFMLHVGSAISTHLYFLCIMVCKCTKLFCTNHCSSQSFISTVSMCSGSFHMYKTTDGDLTMPQQVNNKKVYVLQSTNNLFCISCIWLYGWTDGWMDGWIKGCVGGWVDSHMHMHTHTMNCPMVVHSLQSVLWQVHSCFQSEFSTECNLVLHLSISSILSFP